jgi:hypothetical protein
MERPGHVLGDGILVHEAFNLDRISQGLLHLFPL